MPQRNVHEEFPVAVPMLQYRRFGNKPRIAAVDVHDVTVGIRNHLLAQLRLHSLVDVLERTTLKFATRYIGSAERYGQWLTRESAGWLQAGQEFVWMLEVLVGAVHENHALGESEPPRHDPGEVSVPLVSNVWHVHRIEEKRRSVCAVMLIALLDYIDPVAHSWQVLVN